MEINNYKNLCERILKGDHLFQFEINDVLVIATKNNDLDLIKKSLEDKNRQILAEINTDSFVVLDIAIKNENIVLLNYFLENQKIEKKLILDWTFLNKLIGTASYKHKNKSVIFMLNKAENLKECKFNKDYAVSEHLFESFACAIESGNEELINYLIFEKNISDIKNFNSFLNNYSEKVKNGLKLKIESKKTQEELKKMLDLKINSQKPIKKL